MREADRQGPIHRRTLKPRRGEEKGEKAIVMINRRGFAPRLTVDLQGTIGAARTVMFR